MARKLHAAFSPSRLGSLALCEEHRKLFLFCINFALTPPISSYCVVDDFYLLFHPPFASPVELKNFFGLSIHWWQFFGRSTFPQVALSMKILPNLRLPSSKARFTILTRR